MKGGTPRAGSTSLAPRWTVWTGRRPSEACWWPTSPGCSPVPSRRCSSAISGQMSSRSSAREPVTTHGRGDRPTWTGRAPTTWRSTGTSAAPPSTSARRRGPGRPAAGGDGRRPRGELQAGDDGALRARPTTRCRPSTRASCTAPSPASGRRAKAPPASATTSSFRPWAGSCTSQALRAGSPPRSESPSSTCSRGSLPPTPSWPRCWPGPRRAGASASRWTSCRACWRDSSTRPPASSPQESCRGRSATGIPP